MSPRLDGGDGPSTANVLTAQFDAGPTGPIELYDNTLREGEQPPGVVFTSDEKMEIARALDQFGVHWANVGFPAVSKEELAGVQRITKAGLRMKTAALCRLLPEDVDATVDSGVNLVSLFLATSDVHLRDKLKLTEAEAMKKIEAAVRRVKDRGVACAFTTEDGTRTPLDRLLRIFKLAQDVGADYLILADTVGVLTPNATRGVIGALAAQLQKPIGLHFHDDLGLALANTLAGLEAGARMAHVTVNGVGERSGNTCLEELSVVLKVKYGRDLGFRLERLHELSSMVHRASGTKTGEHKSIVGRWCFTHESGIHVAGLLSNPETYQPYAPALVGRTHEIAFGKHSGQQSVAYLCELAGVTLSDEARKRVLDRIKQRAEQKQGTIDTRQAIELVQAER
jgi:isopropylmalate/homocitrate/citramalate synthase